VTIAPEGCDAKRLQVFDGMNHPTLSVEINYIDREEQSDRMDALAWNQPQTLA
jgi:hypothetical protein